MAQEMLTDYAYGRLDQDRKMALDDFMQTNPEIRHELKLILEADKYCAHLAKTEISKKFLNELQQVRSFGETTFVRLRWKNWPEMAKWTVEALLISVAVAIAAIMVPWDQIHLPKPDKTNVIVTRAVVPPSPEVKPPAAPTVAPVLAKPPGVAVALPMSAAKTVATPPAAPTQVVAVLPAPSATTTVPKPSHPSLAVATPVAKLDDESATDEVKQGGREMKGMLYRVLLDLDNSDSYAIEIKDKLLALGAEKAGKVELGWRKKGPKGNYYHFTLPEKSYSRLLTTLGVYGPVRIFKNSHERVMPEGQIRIILWVEDKAPSSDNTNTSMPSGAEGEGQ